MRKLFISMIIAMGISLILKPHSSEKDLQETPATVYLVSDKLTTISETRNGTIELPLALVEKENIYLLTSAPNVYPKDPSTTERIKNVKKPAETPAVSEIIQKEVDLNEIMTDPNSIYSLNMGSVSPTRQSIYVPSAKITSTLLEDGTVISKTVFKNGKFVDYDIDLYIEAASEEELLYRLVEAEGGNQAERCKQLICDCVLNMRDSASYPETIKGCIFNDGSFDVTKDGSMFIKTPQENTVLCVDTELVSRLSYEVMYFRTKHYHGFGHPMENVGIVYFSTP